MPVPRLDGVDTIEEDLASTESSWALYKEYSEDLKASMRFGETAASFFGAVVTGASNLVRQDLPFQEGRSHLECSVDLEDSLYCRISGTDLSDGRGL